jgi:FkbM family methyltransferase
MSDEILARIEQKLEAIEKRIDAIESNTTETRRMISPWAATLADGKLMVNTLHGNLMIVESLDLIITPQLVIYRQWEPELSQIIWNSLRPDSVFVDVGANIGYFTVLAGDRIHAGGTGRVIAIEPNPDCCELIERNLIINWSMCPIDLHKVAVGAEDGEVWLAIPENRAANAHLTAAGEEEGLRRCRVPMRTLDELVPEGLAVDILKVDVEGHELAVFQGAARVIAESPNVHVIMEWSLEQMAEAKVSVTELQEKLESLGLVARRLPYSWPTLVGLSTETSPLISFDELGNIPYENILLTKRA